MNKERFMEKVNDRLHKSSAQTNSLVCVLQQVNHIIETYNNNKCPECNNGLVFSGKGDEMCCRSCEQNFSLAVYMGILDIALDQL